MDFFARTFDSEFVVCSIDVGTATSSMSIVHVKKGENMQTLHDKVYRVKKWSYHKQRTADIPTAMCYRNGQPIDKKMGANAKPPGPGEDWVVVKNFKRHVAKLGSNDTSNLGSLPAGVSLARVYEDWLKFIFKSGSEAFNEDSDIPDAIWDRRMVVFVAPNGWTESEKANVRKIIHRARCVEYDDHVRFARESEATFHYCLYHGLGNDLSKPLGLEFFICNAGAATTDLGFYKVTSIDPLQYSEVQPAISLDGGSLYENTVTDYNTVNMIENAVKTMRSQASANPKYLILGGGFANNQAVKDQLGNNLKPFNIQVDAPFQKPSEFGVEESPTVDGALYSFLWNYVATRAAALTYGTNIVVVYNDSNEEHRRRIANATYTHAGVKHVNYAWENIVKKGDLVRDGEKVKHFFRQLYNTKPTENQTMSFTLYGASNTYPTWMRQEDGSTLTPGVREICTVSGPIHINDVTINEVKWGPNNSNTAYEIPYHFDIDFGSVTSKANIVWTGKNEKPAFSPATFHPPHDSEVLWGNL